MWRCIELKGAAVFNYEVVKKIVYAIEQAMSARHYLERFDEELAKEIAYPLDEAIADLRKALAEAADAE